MQAWDDFTITLRVKKRGSSRKLVGFRKDSLRRCAPAPSEGTPSGASRQLPLGGSLLAAKQRFASLLEGGGSADPGRRELHPTAFREEPKKIGRRPMAAAPEYRDHRCNLLERRCGKQPRHPCHASPVAATGGMKVASALATVTTRACASASTSSAGRKYTVYSPALMAVGMSAE